MQLQAYLASKGLSEKQFADQIGASESGVVKWVRRERIPRPEKIREIARITEGAVTAADFFDLPGDIASTEDGSDAEASNGTDNGPAGDDVRGAA